MRSSRAFMQCRRSGEANAAVGFGDGVPLNSNGGGGLFRVWLSETYDIGLRCRLQILRCRMFYPKRSRQLCSGILSCRQITSPSRSQH